MQRVSVVIPARNAAGTLARAIRSVLAQSEPAYEIIVVDDASEDATRTVAETFPQVQLISRNKSGGAAAARNAGIRAAQSSWIAFLDADDEWLPEKLERQNRLCRGGVSLVFCASEEFGADGVSLGDTFRGGPVDCSMGAWRSLLKTNFIATPTVIAPRRVLLEMGGFDEQFAVGEDQDMWIRLALAGRVAYVPETLARIHVQPKSLSAYRRADQAEYVLPMIERHLGRLSAGLTRMEVRTIRGERLANAGRIALANGDILQGAAYILRAGLTGHRPLHALAAIAKAPAAHFSRLLPHRQTA